MILTLAVYIREDRAINLRLDTCSRRASGPGRTVRQARNDCRMSKPFTSSRSLTLSVEGTVPSIRGSVMLSQYDHELRTGP
jgi:hypothetical protein